MEKELICIEQCKELQKRNSKLKVPINNNDSGYYYEDINNIKLVLKDNKIYVLVSMRETTLNWYYYYLNHPRGDQLGNTIKETCY